MVSREVNSAPPCAVQSGVTTAIDRWGAPPRSLKLKQMAVSPSQRQNGREKRSWSEKVGTSYTKLYEESVCCPIVLLVRRGRFRAEMSSAIGGPAAAAVAWLRHCFLRRPCPIQPPPPDILRNERF